MPRNEYLLEFLCWIQCVPPSTHNFVQIGSQHLEAMEHASLDFGCCKVDLPVESTVLSGDQIGLRVRTGIHDS